MKKVAVLFADGFEEIEALTPVDILNRAGVAVTMVAVYPKQEMVERAALEVFAKRPTLEVTGSHHITVKMDAVLQDVHHQLFDAIILPGGMPGAKNLKQSSEVIEWLQDHQRAGKLIAALCAAPIALNAAGILENKKFTCYPGFEEEIQAGEYTAKLVEKDERLITGCGPAAAFEFSYAIVEALGIDSENLRGAMRYQQLLEK